MKANTPELMKFKRLQRKLGDTRRGTIGLLESMWIEVARNCPQGDIGRFTNEEIAIMLDWDGDPDLLVESLVECRWLDACATHRLVVHDWKDHCPTYVRGGLSRQNKDIAIATTLEVEPIGTTSTQSATTSEGDAFRLSLPSQAYSSQAKPSQIKESGQAGHDDLFEQFWDAFPRVRRTKKGDARKRWVAVTKKVSPHILIQRASEYAQSEKGRSEYAVMPSVWLNSAMWEDDPAAWGSPAEVDRTPREEDLLNWTPGG